MSPLGCQYVLRTYWTDVSTPAVAAGIVWLRGPKIRDAVGTRRSHGERGEHPRLYKQDHSKAGVQFECNLGVTACTRNKDTDGPPTCVLCKSFGNAAHYLRCPQASKKKMNLKPTNNKKTPTPPSRSDRATPSIRGRNHGKFIFLECSGQWDKNHKEENHKEAAPTEESEASVYTSS
ncbi:hypothetical protein EVAR_86111_1 [Eumeta japonica]|uniref:Nucleic-acid-binding protein from transposon X-element n=1 Tax=Eumeta variegata TaxID=151549 RepID=A0A4C1V192_EUMVA|nr:hypothetical protein EVAR_86111_1 [Eumeta japonica]